MSKNMIVSRSQIEEAVSVIDEHLEQVFTFRNLGVSITSVEEEQIERV